jgi:uncharacterized 2Fe-2S/4Fe-4S cluster protein (DUF4445 family)
MYLTLYPGEKRIHFDLGATLQEILAGEDIFFAHPCGGKGTCGHCRVLFRENAPEPTEREKKFLKPDQLNEGMRLSCCTHPAGGSVVELVGGEKTRFTFAMSDETSEPVTLEPLVRKSALDIDIPTLEKQGNFLSRILEKLRPNGFDFRGPVPVIPEGFLQRLPRAIQSSEGHITVTHDDSHLIEIEAGNTRGSFYGLAVDIGTTTLAARLIDMNSGHILTQSATLNSQSKIGIDVVNRIDYCRKDPEGLNSLQNRVLADIKTLVEDMLELKSIDRHQVAQVTIVGNPTMMQLLLGVDPLSIAVAPYSPSWTQTLRVPAEQLGLRLASGCEAVIGPAVSAYVGADVVAGALACGMDHSAEMALLVDVGTNGEMILGNRDRLLAATTAAGPAFEGAQISCGTWAAPGAIDKVQIDGEVKIHTLHREPPIGICGSGLVDATAELLRQEVITMAGRMLDRDSVNHLPEPVARCLQKADGQPAFLLSESRQGPLYLTAGDVRQVQLAKGAIQSGVTILMKEMGITPADIDKVYLAGAFGRAMNKENLRRLGFFQNIEDEKISGIGNSALAGAQLMLLSRKHLERLNRLHDSIEFLELSSYAGFMEAFSDAMMFSEE